MDKSAFTDLYQPRGAQTVEEIIGVLTAISVVSKRMAKKLALIEQQSAEKRDVKSDEELRSVPTHAD